MALSEADKDRVAETVNRLIAKYRSGDPELWSEANPEAKLGEAMAALSPEELAFAEPLLEQIIVREDERGPDPVMERIDAAEAEGKGSVERDNADGGQN